MSQSSKIIVRNSNIYNTNGALFRPDVSSADGKDDKNFAVLVKCGHVGRDYFMPIIFSINAKDKKHAIEIAKYTPRVKHDEKDWLLGIKEISTQEHNLISYINNGDQYLTTDLDKNTREVFNRRVADTLLVDIYNGAPVLDRYFAQERFDDHFIVTRDQIKTADEYLPKLILQRVTAPILQGGKFVYRKSYNMDEILKEYYKAFAISCGIFSHNGVNLTPLSYYYQIMGKDNDLGIVFDGKYLRLNYDGRNYCVKLRKEQTQYFKDERVNEGYGMFKKSSNNFEIDFDELEPSRPSQAIERFNKKLEAHKKIKEAQVTRGRQPGEE